MRLPWEVIFNSANVFALICWLFLLFAPRREKIIPYIFMIGCGLMALTYSVLIVGLITGILDMGGPRSGNLSSLSGVIAFFQSRGGATTGWIHYLTFDLLVGVWVAGNADRHGFHRLVQIPVLLLTYLLGPMGLTLYLVIRKFSQNRPEIAVAPM